MFQEKIVSFFYLKIFLLILVILILGSIIAKVTNEVLSSSFKNNSFSLLYLSNDSKLIFVDKAQNSAEFIAIGNIKNLVKGKTPLEASFILGVPIDGVITDNNPPQNLSDFSSPKNVMRLMFGGNRVVLKNLDVYDIYKLSNAIRAVPKDNKHEVRVNLFDQEDFKAKVGDGFNDSVVNNTPLTVEIDNGTSIDGLGNDFASILTREGFNIISVKTATQDSSSFIAYPKDGNIVTSSLIGLTGFPLKKAQVSQSADITIFLGNDLDAMLSP